MKLCLVIIFIWISVSLSAEEKPLDRIVSETLLTQLYSDYKIEVSAISPDRRRVAYISGVNYEYFVVVDGKEQKKYGRYPSVPIFSPDSKHVAYSTGKFVVVDGEEQKKYDDGVPLDDSPIFSPDSKRMAYTAYKAYNKCVWVVDGKEENYDTAGAGDLIFSPDSNRIAYIAEDSNKEFVVVDGKEQKKYDFTAIRKDSVIFSPDSKRVAYVTERGGNYIVVIDGIECGEYKGIDDLNFSPDGKQIVYWAERDGIGMIVVNGVEIKTGCWTIRGLIFSPDSKHMAYIAYDGDSDKYFVVVDGKEQKKYDGIGGDSPIIFSPDSKRIAYVAQISDYKYCVVVDGNEGKKYESILEDTLIFSPDSNRIAYAVERLSKGGCCVVVDGKEQKKYDGIGTIVFSPDSEYVMYVAEVNEEWQTRVVTPRGELYIPGYTDLKRFVVVENTEGKGYDDIISAAGDLTKFTGFSHLPKKGGIVFDSSNSFHYLVLKDGCIWLVEEKIK